MARMKKSVYETKLADAKASGSSKELSKLKSYWKREALAYILEHERRDLKFEVAKHAKILTLDLDLETKGTVVVGITTDSAPKCNHAWERRSEACRKRHVLHPEVFTVRKSWLLEK